MNIATDENEVIETDIEVMLESESDADAEAVGITDDDFTQAERDHYESIKRANIEVSIAQSAYDRANGIAKAAKKDLELASLELSTLISDGPQLPDPQKELPFPSDETASPTNDWQLTPISEVLKLTEAQREKLESAGITTIGRLEHVRGGQDPDYPRGLRSIKGFGEKTIDALENDVVEWLSKNARETNGDE